jgi:hypothetical protein
MFGLVALVTQLLVHVTLLLLGRKRLHDGVKVKPPSTTYLALAPALAFAFALILVPCFVPMFVRKRPLASIAVVTTTIVTRGLPITTIAPLP